MTRMWWKKTVVYQIYPRSFKDSTGDGIGDIPGIISKLDYLCDLGIETIWLSPFFSSPQRDHGYDVSDYRDIAPEYGTLADCERLIEEIHNLEMRVVFDMVLNHTSDQHPWFMESRSSRNNSKRDWYVWRDGRKPGGKKPPNNWNSVIGGSGWHYDDSTDQWYWAQFLPFQPDLNYRNPEVKEEMFDMMRFWLDKGVDGFRLDIINAVYEDEQLRNNPLALKYLPSEEDTRAFFHDNIHTINHPENFVFVKELRRLMDEYSDPERFLVGEVGAPLEILRQYCGEEVEGNKTDGLHMVFQFQSLSAKLEANALRKLMLAYEQFFSEPYIPTWVFSNHDRRRRISRLGGSVEKAKLNVLFQLTARGVPFIYQGEEVGMLGLRIPLENAQDPVALKYSRLPRVFTGIAEKLAGISLNRDECRTPMQWDSSPNAGFCQAGIEPWLPMGSEYERTNVDAARANPDSLLNCYKALLHLRRNNAALNSGSIHLVQVKAPQGLLLSYERRYNKQTVQMWLNLSERPLTIEGVTTSKQLLFSTLRGTDPVQGEAITLEPLQGIITEL
jgi:glycosidase